MVACRRRGGRKRRRELRLMVNAFVTVLQAGVLGDATHSLADAEIAKDVFG